MTARRHQVAFLLAFLVSIAAASAGCSETSPEGFPTTTPSSQTPTRQNTEAHAAASPNPSPEPSLSDARIPTVGQLAFPYEVDDAGNNTVLAGAEIDVDWIDAPPGAQRYDFLLAPEDTQIPFVWATDTDISDGAGGTFLVPEHLSATLSAIAYSAYGAMLASAPSILVHSGQAPPSDVCTLRSPSVGVIDIFQEHSTDSAKIGYLPPGTFLTVLGRTTDDWFWIDAMGAPSLGSEQSTSGMGWIIAFSPIDLFGACDVVGPPIRPSDPNSTAISPTWASYIGPSFAFDYPPRIPVRSAPGQALIYTEPGAAFILSARGAGSVAGDNLLYFLDMPANGSQPLGQYTWTTYYLPQGYCDGPSCTAPIYALQMELGLHLYSAVFYGQASLSDLQAMILSTFRALD